MERITMNLIKAELMGILTAQEILDRACIAQENINASNSVISNNDLPVIRRLGNVETN